MPARLATDVAVENADRPRRPRAAVRTVPAVLGDVSGRGMSEIRVAQASKKCHGACPLMVRRILSGDDRPAVAVRPCRSVPGPTTPSALRRFAASAFDYTTIIFRRSMGAVRAVLVAGTKLPGQKGPSGNGPFEVTRPFSCRRRLASQGACQSRVPPVEDRQAGFPGPVGRREQPTGLPSPENSPQPSPFSPEVVKSRREPLAEIGHLLVV